MAEPHETYDYDDHAERAQRMVKDKDVPRNTVYLVAEPSIEELLEEQE